MVLDLGFQFEVFGFEIRVQGSHAGPQDFGGFGISERKVITQGSHYFGDCTSVRLVNFHIKPTLNKAAR